MAHIIFSDIDSNDVEIRLSPKQQAVLDDTVPGNSPQPIDILIDVEEFLMEEYGITYIQACKLGVFK